MSVRPGIEPRSVPLLFFSERISSSRFTQKCTYSPRIPIKLSGMNGSRSDSTDFHNIPYLKQIPVAIHEFLLADRQAGGQDDVTGSPPGCERSWKSKSLNCRVVLRHFVCPVWCLISKVT